MKIKSLAAALLTTFAVISTSAFAPVNGPAQSSASVTNAPVRDTQTPTMILLGLGVMAVIVRRRNKSNGR